MKFCFYSLARTLRHFVQQPHNHLAVLKMVQYLMWVVKYLKLELLYIISIDLKGMSFDGILGMSLQDSTNGPLNISQNNNGTAPLNMPILQMLKNANICENQIFSLYLRRISHSNNSTGGQLTLCGINPQHYKVCNYFNLIFSEK